jgi:phage gpG-like protein
MTARITIDEREVTAALRELARLGRDPSAPLTSIGSALIGSTKLRALTATSPTGARWPMLGADYAATKKGTPLRESGLMLGGLISEVSGSRLRVGSDRPYAAIHQFGGTITAKGRALDFFIGRRRVRVKRVRIPARPWLGVSASDRTEILNILAEHARRATQGRA